MMWSWIKDLAIFNKEPPPPQTPSDVLLEKIKNILFPKLELREDMSKDGEKIIFHVDYSVDANLQSVINDLQDGYNDENCHKILKDMVDRMVMIRRLLREYQEIDPKVKYIIVDSKKEEFEPDAIKALDN